MALKGNIRRTEPKLQASKLGEQVTRFIEWWAENEGHLSRRRRRG